MGLIHRLDPMLVAQIAAGEVIENPAAVLKELMENSLDAGSSKIDVILRDNGYRLLQVRDNGRGILAEDLPLAVESFATSKIQKLDDLQNIFTLGFRGEALGSIRSVSQLTIESRPLAQKNAYRISCDPQQTGQPEACALDHGCRILVENLFANTPVRREFQKNQLLVKKQILETFSNYALGYPEVDFSLDDGHSHLAYPARPALLQRITDLYQADFSQSLLPVYFQSDDGKLTVEGYISNRSFFKSQKSFLRFFVNRRPVEFPRLWPLLKKVYGELLPPGRFPVAFLFLTLPPDHTDVNIHPQKKELLFKQEGQIDQLLFRALNQTIGSDHRLPIFAPTGPEKNGTSQPPRQESFMPPASPESGLFSGELARENHGNYASAENRLPVSFQVHARLFDTFVLASSEAGVFLVDQHTAHERINYENYLESLPKKEKLAQNLLSPIALHLTAGEKESLGRLKKRLEQSGFLLEDLGPAGYSLQAAPFYLEPGQEESGLHLALKILEQNPADSALELFEELAASLACRSAVKKGDPESVATLQELIARLFQCREPYRCPHGRPTLVFLDRDEIFRLFKRQI